MLQGARSRAFILLAFGAEAVASAFTNDPWYSPGVILLLVHYLLPGILAMIWRIFLRSCVIIALLAILGYLCR